MSDRTHSARKEPAPLGDVVSQLFALRGYGQTRGDRQLQDAWRETAGEQVFSQTRPLGVRNGVLQVGVASSGLLSELATFHKHSLLERLQNQYKHLKIHDIKFKLRGDLGARPRN
jgi:hypothetical protein